MPDFMQTLMDRIHEKPKIKAVDVLTQLTGTAFLPASGWAAMLRGLRGCCPRCGETRLFFRFLKPVSKCLRCDQDWTHQQADDFPAYVSILVTGHLMAPLIIGLTRDADLSPTAMISIILPTALVLMISILQPAKGAIIALQWWFGMHGFVKERPDEAADEEEA